MKTPSSPRNRALQPAVAWVGIAMLSLGALLGAPSAMAAPPAFTMIGQQATASYLDGNGTTQQSSSNVVQTQVQQVGAFTLDSVSSVTTTVVNTKTGASGNIVYAAHTLTNTGNGADNFNVVVTNGPNGTAGVLPAAVYADADGNGLPDSTTALCTAVAGATCTVPAQAVAGNGGVFRFVVAYTIPLNATTPTTPYSSATITVTPGNTTLYTTTSAADVDNVNLTTDAAFSATLSLAVPLVTGPGGTAYPAVSPNGKHSLASSSCPVTMTSARTPAAGCVYSTYTMNFGNTGGAAGVFYANATLPSGLTYVVGSTVWSGASGQALGEAAGTADEPVAGVDFVQSGQNLSVRIGAVNPNVAGSVSFMVLVNSTATVGTALTSTYATYDPVTSLHTAAVALTPGSTNTNSAAYTVTPSYGVVLGSNGGTATVTASADATAGTPQGTTGTAGADQNVVASMASGGTVKFIQTLWNNGDVADTFNLSSANATNGFPAGSNVTFFKADGVTPLIDTNGDSIVDSGLVAGGASMKFVVQVQIPATTLANTTTYALVVRATSYGDSTKFDASGDQVNAVTGILMDLTNTNPGTGSGSVGGGDLGAGPSPTPTVTHTTPAGTTATYTLFIRNGENSQSNNFNLDVSQAATFPGSVPTGWTVKFVVGNAGCAAAAITNTGTILANGFVQVDACVTPSTSAPAATTDLYFRAVSALQASTGVTLSDIVHDSVSVTVAVTYMTTVTPSNTGQVNPGGTVVYAHNLTNTGSTACTAYTVSVTPTNTSSGWTYSIFNDVNNDSMLDGGDTPNSGTGSGPAVATSTKFLVKAFAPGGATAGQTDSATFTVSYTATDGTSCGSHSVTDTSTVVVGQVRAYKTQWLNTSCNDGTGAVFNSNLINTAKPSQCITYQIIAINEGSAPITNLAISDAVPSYTTLATTQPSGACLGSSSSVTGTLAFVAGSDGTVKCSTATSVPPSSNLTMRFTVQIAP